MIPTGNDLLNAYAVTRRATQRTPLLDSGALARATGAVRVFVKAESLQHAGSFKIRGAYWRLTRLSEDERESGVVAYSSGNFAQGLAAAGQAQGVPVTIVMPIDAPATKRIATESYGARVVLSDHGDRPREEAAAELAREIAARDGLVLLHPFDDPEIVAGQAGAGLEALEQLREIGAKPDIVVCPVGGGGLIGGVALAFRNDDPDVRIFAVEPEGYDCMGTSLTAGETRRVTSGRRTICDALQATQPGAAPFEAARAAGVTGIAIGDAAVVQALRFAFEKLKLVLEPSGAIALAALLDGRVDAVGREVVVYVTGGNVAPETFMGFLVGDRA
ncbi:L-threonine dehydratase catabolic TdcB [Defluviimonas aquaemixtae]|uniref:L-threonine dehydratase catabolic TdcB n=1 Tax=Albidovulum aquaemixtae TaxID=1542388 RepID=A0A2R8B7D6_9RHOB|nr:pyridoxal-phosphate dependent enzyme [Defluviimonas aquaemixtae]SPH18537.1 L-threonine dehydratase catabolic TdcB [Defluviimonas aquaemixtae]